MLSRLMIALIITSGIFFYVLRVLCCVKWLRYTADKEIEVKKEV